MRTLGNIQGIPTPRLYVTRGYSVPEVRAALSVGAALSAGSYFEPAVPVGPLDAGRASVAAALAAGDYVADVPPTVTASAGDATVSASLASGVYFASIVPPPSASDLGASSVSVTLAASSYALTVVALAPYPEHVAASASLDSGEYV